MAAQVTGKLESSVNNTAEVGSLEITLCGYGSRVPRINGVALVARIEDESVVASSTGAFTFTCPFNDDIAPAGTYYTVAIKDSNGDIAQINAYRFTSNTSSYDLTLIDPYDPNQPPPPLPPLITNQLEIVAPADNMVFDGTAYTAFKTTLASSVTIPSIQNMLPGNLYTFIIVQDATGGHVFDWPATVHNPARVCPTPSSFSVQTFVADDNENLWAIGPGTWSL
jgi:hypothetical protein